MGLHISTMQELPAGDRSLFIYLLDYGWPNGPYERLFRENFGAMARRAEETHAVVIMSDRGIHFADEVLSWHSILGYDAAELLPAVLITHTHPSYFERGQRLSDGGAFRDLALIPLKQACTTPEQFQVFISSIFSDLEKGHSLRNFQAVKFDALGKKRSSASAGLIKRVGRAVLLQPNFAGVGVDLKKLFSATPEST